MLIVESDVGMSGLWFSRSERRSGARRARAQAVAAARPSRRARRLRAPPLLLLLRPAENSGAIARVTAILEMINSSYNIKYVAFSIFKIVLFSYFIVQKNEENPTNTEQPIIESCTVGTR